MSLTPWKGTRLIFMSGLLNCLLGIVHQIILYDTYMDYANQGIVAPTSLLLDFLLFSMATGTTLFFVGLLTCYSYRGIVQGEKRSTVIAVGISGLLFLFAVKIFAVFGFSHPIAYVHCVNALLIIVPLAVMKKAGSRQSGISVAAAGK